MIDSYWTELPRLTVSSVADLACSWKYTELRVKKHWPKDRKAPPISVPRGTAIHATVHDLYRNRWGDELPMAELPSMARRAVFGSRYERGVDKDREALLVADAARLFAENCDPEDTSAILALETKIDVDYHYQGEALACLSATIDRALVRPDEPDVLILQDLKTTSQKIDLKESCLQMFCARKRWPEYRACRLELIWLDVEEGQVEVDVIEERHVRGQMRSITADLLRVLRQEPVKEPGPAVCLWCPLRKGCETVGEAHLVEGEEPF